MTPQWSGMITEYANRFGNVKFRPIAALADVKTIRGADLDPACMFDIETAEKIALITDNRRIQLCPFMTPLGWRCYVALHDSPSTAAVAEIESITYVGTTPAEEIQAARTGIF